MAKTDSKASCCTSDSKLLSCCKVESLISVDERGQMVMPKEVRDRAGIKAGDKLALISWETRREDGDEARTIAGHPSVANRRMCHYDYTFCGILNLEVMMWPT